MIVRNPWLHFYWIEFLSPPLRGREGYAVHGRNYKFCGVTAYTPEDALYLISVQLSYGWSLPPVLEIIEDVNLATIDDRHILPHVGVPIFRGVWYPSVTTQGYRRGYYPDEEMSSPS